MTKTRPVNVTNAEILRSLNERTAGADEARQDRLVALQNFSTARMQVLKRELERLKQKHDADHPLVGEADARLQANTNSLRALGFEIQRTSLTPPKPAAEAWTVFGIVRAKDGTPLPGVFVGVTDANGDVVAPEKRIPTEKDGAFSIVVPIVQRKARKAKAAAEPEEEEKLQSGNVHLQVFKPANKRIAVDEILFHPTAAVVDYRELVVGSMARVNKRAT